jgi:hypothetical protein
MKEGYRIFRPLCVLLVPLAHLSSPVNLQFSWANGKNRNIIISESSLFSACAQKWDFTDAFVFCLLWVSRCAFFPSFRSFIYKVILHLHLLSIFFVSFFLSLFLSFFLFSVHFQYSSFTVLVLDFSLRYGLVDKRVHLVASFI